MRALCHVLWSVELGGAERVVLDLARVQRARGHRVLVLTLSDDAGALSADFRAATHGLFAIPKGRGTDVRLPFRLARWFRAEGVDLVHTHNELPLIYAAPAGKLARLPVVHSKHGVVSVSPRAHLLRRAAARAVDTFVAVSDSTAETALANRETSARKLRTVINGTDLSRFPAPEAARAAIRNELGIPTDARVLVTVGRLVKEKNHALLLRAAAPLLGPDRRLVIVGYGALEGELRARVAAMPERQYVHFTGARRDIPELLAAADAFVLSSDSEGLPIGLLEAWAATKPVVATAVGGIPAALTDEETGLLVPKGDETALRRAIERVLVGGAEISAMSDRGCARAHAVYSAEAMADAYDALYEPLF